MSMCQNLELPMDQVEKLLLEASDAPEEVSYKNQLSALPGIQAPFAECRA